MSCEEVLKSLRELEGVNKRFVKSCFECRELTDLKRTIWEFFQACTRDEFIQVNCLMDNSSGFV